MDFTNRIPSWLCIQDSSLWFTYIDTVGYINGEQVIRRDKIDIFSGDVIASAYSDWSDGTGWSNDPSIPAPKVVGGISITNDTGVLPAGITRFTVTSDGADTFDVSFDAGVTNTYNGVTGSRTWGNGFTIIADSDQIEVTTTGTIDITREF